MLALLLAAFATQTKIVGTIQYGETINVAYTSAPEYRAVRFSGKKGSRVGALVHSDDGDAILWVTDRSFNVLAVNDDATPETVDAHVAVQLPRDDTYYVVFREYEKKPAHFAVSVSNDTRPPLGIFTRRRKPH